jgi:replicative DNA helicase
MGVEDIIKNLEQEIVQTQKGVEQAESLERLKEVAKVYNGEDKVIPFEDIVQKIKKGDNEEKIMSGWQGLDDILKGFRYQQLIVVSALTKSGKTSFLMDLTTRIQEYHPLWFAFEESAEELIRKYVDRGEEPPRAYTPEITRGNAMDWLESKIVEAIAKYNTRIVFIDHLDFVVSFKAENHHLNIAQAMRDLKGLAKKWNIVIFLVAHLTKAKMDTQPTIEDLRGSASIGQEADTVILLWRETKREDGQVVITDNVNVSVQANRRTGRTGNVKMCFADGKFTEKDWESDVSAAQKAFRDF